MRIIAAMTTRKTEFILGLRTAGCGQKNYLLLAPSLSCSFEERDDFLWVVVYWIFARKKENPMLDTGFSKLTA